MMLVQSHSKSNDTFTRPVNQEGVLLNTDLEGLQAYKAMKRRLNQLNTVEQLVEKVQQLEMKINQLEQQLNDRIN